MVKAFIANVARFHQFLKGFSIFLTFWEWFWCKNRITTVFTFAPSYHAATETLIEPLSGHHHCCVPGGYDLSVFFKGLLTWYLCAAINHLYIRSLILYSLMYNETFTWKATLTTPASYGNCLAQTIQNMLCHYWCCFHVITLIYYWYYHIHGLGWSILHICIYGNIYYKCFEFHILEPLVHHLNPKTFLSFLVYIYISLSLSPSLSLSVSVSPLPLQQCTIKLSSCNNRASNRVFLLLIHVVNHPSLYIIGLLYHTNKVLFNFSDWLHACKQKEWIIWLYMSNGSIWKGSTNYLWGFVIAISHKMS